MCEYDIYLGPKGFPTYLLQGPSACHIATWTLRVIAINEVGHLPGLIFPMSLRRGSTLNPQDWALNRRVGTGEPEGPCGDEGILVVTRLSTASWTKLFLGTIQNRSVIVITATSRIAS